MHLKFDKHKKNYIVWLATGLSVLYASVGIWNGFTRPLGGYWNPDETRQAAVIGAIFSVIVMSIILFVLIIALKRQKLLAQLLWTILGTALFMHSWDIITKNLVENGRLAAGWLTDTAYLQEPGAAQHRTIWGIFGLLVAVPFLLNAYAALRHRKS